jgi:tartrate dehydrogenase/decarboxylase/D-malate dehydrogenase
VTFRIAVLPGDGVGPEVIAEARKAVDALGLSIEWTELPWGSAFFHEHGRMMAADALDTFRGHDAVLLGAIGDPSVPDHVALWGATLEIRQGLDLWANVRPCRLLPGVPSPLAGGRSDDVDTLFVRENTEGEYAGVGGRSHRGLPAEVALETSVFTRSGVERIVRYAFELASDRRRLLTSATKSNASRYGYVLWDEVVDETAADFPDVGVERVLVDALAFEPVHGSAPDIAGKGIANPVGAIWSAVLMLGHLGEADAAAALMDALERVCSSGPRTRDIGGEATTAEVGDTVAAAVARR